MSETSPPSGLDEFGAIDAADPPFPALAVTEADAEIEAEGTIRAGKLAGKSLWTGIWILAIPVLLQQAAAACVGLVDKIIAGNLPPQIVVDALDGLGVGSYIGWFIGIAMTGLGLGGQAIIARAMGAGNRAESHRALGQAMSLSVLWGILVGALMWIGVGPIAEATLNSAEATLYCIQYVRMLAYAMPFCGILMVGAMCMYGAGETTQPAIIALGINVVNIVFSWMLSGADISMHGFTMQNPFSFDLHVVGIAAGSSISYAVGGVWTLMVLRRGVKDLRLERPDLSLDRSMTKRIVRIGVPNFAEGISMWAVNLFVLMIIDRIQRADVDDAGLQGAHIIAVQWESFSFLPGFAIGTAAAALAGQYLGARNPRMATRAVLTCTGLACAVMGLFGLLFMFGGEWLTRIISDKPVHLENTPRLLFICGTVQIFFAITMVMRQGLRGVGDTKWTFLITTVSSYGVRLPAAYVLGVVMNLGLTGVWFALCGEFIVRAAMFSARFFHGGWKNLKI